MSQTIEIAPQEISDKIQTKSKKKKSSALYGAAFNIANGTVGAGILGLYLIQIFNFEKDCHTFTKNVD